MVGGEEITIVRPARVDKFGDPIPGAVASTCGISVSTLQGPRKVLLRATLASHR